MRKTQAHPAVRLESRTEQAKDGKTLHQKPKRKERNKTERNGVERARTERRMHRTERTTTTKQNRMERNATGRNQKQHNATHWKRPWVLKLVKWGKGQRPPTTASNSKFASRRTSNIKGGTLTCHTWSGSKTKMQIGSGAVESCNGRERERVAKQSLNGRFSLC